MRGIPRQWRYKFQPFIIQASQVSIASYATMTFDLNPLAYFTGFLFGLMMEVARTKGKLHGGSSKNQASSG
jgi:hypothetical protein